MIQSDKKNHKVKVNGSTDEVEEELATIMAIFVRILLKQKFTHNQVIDKLAMMCSASVHMAEEPELWENGVETMIAIPRMEDDNE